MVVLVIAAILATLAVPAFREFIAAQRVKTASFEIMSMLTLTRSEAIKRNSTAMLSGIGSGDVVVTAGGVTIQRHEPFTNLTLTCKSSGAEVGCSDVVYSSNGRLQAIAASIEISSSATEQKSCIRIDPSGSPSSKNGAC
jgi:type IV fimbrial biogenesis protein FimT